MSFTTIDLTDGGQIKIGEAQEDGSFVRTDGPDPQVVVKFRIWGADDASTAYNAMLSYLHSNFNDGYGGIASYNLPLDTIQISAGASLYAYTAECTFKYATTSSDVSSASSYDNGSDSSGSTSSKINSDKYKLPEIEDSDFQFDTSGGSSHIRHAISTLGSVRVDGNNPVDYGGLIGPREDGSADGIDIVTPTMKFSITLSLPKRWFTSDYRILIAEATGRVNSTAWGGFAAGSCLFTGVSAKATWLKWTSFDGSSCRDWYWRATFSFEGAPAQYVNVGGRTLYKRGFDAFSQVSESYSDGNGNTCSVVVQYDVLQVYPEFNFYSLNLPMPS